MGEDVGHDAVLAGIAIETRGLPLRPGSGQVVEQLTVVNRKDGVIVVCFGLDQAGAVVLERGPDPVRPLRDLRPGVRTPTQTSPPGSCRRWRSVHTSGIERLTAREPSRSLPALGARFRPSSERTFAR